MFIVYSINLLLELNEIVNFINSFRKTVQYKVPPVICCNRIEFIDTGRKCKNDEGSNL